MHPSDPLEPGAQEKLSLPVELPSVAPTSEGGKNPADMVDGMAFARLYGEPLFKLPQDLYIPPDALDFAQRLALRPQFAGLVGGVSVWLGLPGGVRMAAQGSLPVATVAGRAWTLGELQQLPATEPMLDRLAVDGNPAMWLALDAKATPSDGFASGFWDLVERIVDLSGGVRADPWLVSSKPLAEVRP